VPVYPHLAALDTLDYAEQTLWSETSHGNIRPRRSLIGEAGKLDGVSDDAYDVFLASRVVEHLANPLGALVEWQRVVRPGGYMLLIVPPSRRHIRPPASCHFSRASSSRCGARHEGG